MLRLFGVFKVMSRSVLFSRVAGVALIFSVAATAIVTAAPADVALIKSRKDKLRDMGTALKQVDDELKKRSPDWENVILLNVQVLHERSPYLLKWFPKGSGPESGVKTYALPAIWQKAGDFAKHAKDMEAASVKLHQAAAKKDAGELKAQVIAMGKSCKACHDDYRSPEYEKDAEQQ